MLTKGSIKYIFFINVDTPSIYMRDHFYDKVHVYRHYNKKSGGIKLVMRIKPLHTLTWYCTWYMCTGTSITKWRV